MIELRNRPISDVTSTDVLLLHGNTPIAEAIATLDEYGVSGAPVVDEAGQAIGVFSLADLARRDAEVEEGEAPRAGSYFSLGVTGKLSLRGEGYAPESFGRETVGDWMSTAIQSVPPDATVGRAAEIMANEGIHRVLVMEGRSIRGIVTALDIVRLVAEAPEKRAHRRRSA